MRIRPFIIALMLLGAIAPASAQKTKSVLGSEITSQFPNNITGAITPLILRNVTNDFLNSWQQFPAVNPQTGTSYVFGAGDYGSLTTFNSLSPVTVTLPTPGSGGFGIGWNAFVRNLSTGIVTLSPTGATINGGATATIAEGQSNWVVSDGNNYQILNNSSATLGQSAGSIVVDCGARYLQTITNQGAFTVTAPANDGSCILKTTNTVSASTITFSGFSVGSNTGDALSTTNGFKFMIFVYRVGGDSTFTIKALQ